MLKLIREALGVLAGGSRVALSTIVSASGSLPMSRRSKMLVLPDGTLRGTVGGGCLEAEVYAGAREALEGDGSPILKRFVLTESQAGAEGLNCGGTVEILTEALRPGPVIPVMERCAVLLERREDAVMATALAGPREGAAGKVVLGSGAAVGSLGDSGADRRVGDAAAALMGSDGFRIDEVEGAGKVFMESIPVIPTLILFGGGHVSRETARVAATAGFRVMVVDDREAFASRARHPDADETRVISFDEAGAGLPVDRHTSLVVVTRGHQHDERVVRKLLGSPAAYIGMIGSARKVAILKAKLAAEGFSREALDRLHAPIGLDIGADNPGEIAVSIVAELIAVRRRGGDSRSISRVRRPDR